MFNEKQSWENHSSELGNKEILCGAFASPALQSDNWYQLSGFQNFSSTACSWRSSVLTFVTMAANASGTFVLFARISQVAPWEQFVFLGEGYLYLPMSWVSRRKTNGLKYHRAISLWDSLVWGSTVDLVHIRSSAAARSGRGVVLGCFALTVSIREKLSTGTWPSHLPHQPSRETRSGSTRNVYKYSVPRLHSFSIPLSFIQSG